MGVATTTATTARVRPFEVSQEISGERSRSSWRWLTAKRRLAVSRVVAACGLALAVVLLAELPWRGGRKRSNLAESWGFAGRYQGKGNAEYLRALTDINNGEELANTGKFMPAASEFLRAKDLWQHSGERGWQTAQSLADAAVDK